MQFFSVISRPRKPVRPNDDERPAEYNPQKLNSIAEALIVSRMATLADLHTTLGLLDALMLIDLLVGSAREAQGCGK